MAGFRHWIFVFEAPGFWLVEARSGCDFLGFVETFDTPPIVRHDLVGPSVSIGDAVKRRATKAGVSGATLLGDFDEAKRDGFAYRWADCMVVDAVFFEMLVGTWKASIFLRLTAVMGELDLKAIYHAPAG